MRDAFFLFLALACLAGPARGQEGISPCRLDRPDLDFNRDGIDACTAVIEAPGTSPDRLADALSVRAEIRRTHNDVGGAWGDFYRLIQQWPGDPRGWTGRGLLYERQYDDRRARRDFDQAVAADPAYAPAWRARGNFHSRRGAHALAIADLDMAVRLDPTGLRTLVDRGIAYDRQGDRARALADFNEAIRRDPAYGPAWHNRGVTYHWMENHAAALADFRVARRLMPRDPEELNGLCFSIAFSGGDLNEARAACDEAYRMLGDPLYRANRGLVGLKQGRFQEAWEDFSAVLRDWYYRRDATARYGRGVAALRLGRERAGRSDLRRALRRDPAVAARFERLGIGPSPSAAAPAR